MIDILFPCVFQVCPLRLISAVEPVDWPARNEEGLWWELEKLLCVKQREAGLENLWLGLMVSVWGWEPLVVEPPSSADVPRDVGISVLSPTLAAANVLEGSRFVSLLILSLCNLVWYVFFPPDDTMTSMISMSSFMYYWFVLKSMFLGSSIISTPIVLYWIWTSKPKTTMESWIHDRS